MESSTLSNCGICKKLILFEDQVSEMPDFVSCSNCNHNFHRVCSGVSTKFYSTYMKQKDHPWYCHACYGMMHKRNKSEENAKSFGSENLINLRNESFRTSEDPKCSSEENQIENGHTHTYRNDDINRAVSPNNFCSVVNNFARVLKWSLMESVLQCFRRPDD